MSNKRIMLQVVVVAALVGTLLLASMPALAQEPGVGFVDANSDGVCDNYGSQINFVDADGDGICDNCANGTGFVDADGDGVRDNMGTGLNSANRSRSGGGMGANATGSGQAMRSRGGARGL